MAESHNLGKKGEDLAVEHLRGKGYNIVRRNWKSGRYEVDIIAENKDFMVFVEVKTRSENFLLPPASAGSTKEKQRSLIYLADSYIKWFNITKECRFDVISVIKKEDTFDIDHIEGAFYPTLR